MMGAAASGPSPSPGVFGALGASFSSAVMRPPSSPTHAERGFQPVRRMGHGVAEPEEDGSHECVDLERGAQPLGLGEHRATDTQDLQEADDDDQRGVLEQADEEADV